MTGMPLLLGLLAGLVLLLWLPGGGGGDGRALAGRRGRQAGWVSGVEGRIAGALAQVSVAGGSAGRRRRAHATELQVLDGMAAALEAGLPVARGVRLAVADVGPGLGPSSAAAWSALGRAASEGQQLGPAWERLARHTRSPTLVSVARAWRVADLTGAPLAEALRVSAHAARERHRLGRAVEVAVAGPRATVTVLTLLPVAGVGLAAVLGVGPAQLYGDPVAQAAVGCGAVLLLLGQAWVRRLVAGVLRGTS